MTDFTSAAAVVLAELAGRSGLASWVVARRDGDECVVLAAIDEVYGLAAGTVRGWAASCCAAVLDGAPAAVGDAGAVPVFARIANRRGWQLGAMVATGMYGPDGRLLGGLWGGDPQPRPQAEMDGLASSVVAAAGLLGTVLGQELSLADQVRRVELAEQSADSDPLTGTANRRVWEATVAVEEARAARHASPVAVLLVDVDALKTVNEAAGHAAGDQLLRRVAAVLRDHVRPFDLVARLAGGLFGLLLVETEPAAAAEVVTRLRAELALTGVAAAVGVGTRRSVGGGLLAAWQQADAALGVDKARRRAGGRPRGAGRGRPTTPAGTAASPPLAVSGEVAALLELARAQLGMQVAFLGHLDSGGRRIIRHLVSTVAVPLATGSVAPREQTLCGLLVDGALPAVTSDVTAHPVGGGLSAVAAAGIRAYVGVPVHRRDGSVYGTLCCFSQQPDPSLTDRDARVLEVIAGLLTGLVERDEADRQHRRSLLDRFDRLYAAGGPHMVYQPVVALADHGVVGVEALARFPAGSPSPPDWFATAAQVGAGVELELAAIGNALGRLDALDATQLAPFAGFAGGFVAVNASSATVCDPAFTRLAADWPLHRVVVEITEHEAVADYSTLSAALAPLRERGLRVAVDDTGAGYASMRHVLAIGPDLLKLDISLIRDVDTDPQRQALVAALVTYAAHGNVRVIAEGVETAAELATLLELGVPLGQGYHLGRPAPLPVPADAGRPGTTAGTTAGTTRPHRGGH